MTRNRVYVDTTQRSTALLTADVFQLHDPPKSCKHVAGNTRGHVSTVEISRRFYTYFSGEEHEISHREYRGFHDYTAPCGGGQHQRDWLKERDTSGMTWAQKDWDFWRPADVPAPSIIFVFRNDNGRHIIQKTNLVAVTLASLGDQLSSSAESCSAHAHSCETSIAYCAWKEVRGEFNHKLSELHCQRLSVIPSRDLLYFRTDSDLQSHLLSEQSGEQRCFSVGNQFFVKLDADGNQWAYVISELEKNTATLLSKDIPLKQWTENGELTTKLFELRIQALGLPDRNNGRHL